MKPQVTKQPVQPIRQRPVRREREPRQERGREPPCIDYLAQQSERWGAGVETQKNVPGEIGGWGRVPYNEPYAPSLSTIYDGA